MDLTVNRGPSQRVLIWTKARKDWVEEERLLAPQLQPGWQLMHIPCIEIEPVPLIVPPQTPDYVVVTSANAARRAAADQSMKQAMRAAKQVYTHGAKTAQVLRALGIDTTLVSSAQTAEDLCAWIGQNLQRPAQIWLPTAAQPAFDMAAGLAARGFSTTVLPCYKTVSAAKQANGDRFTEALVAQLCQSLSGVVCFASPSAVAGFAAVFAPTKDTLGASLHACVIGPTTAAAAAPYFTHVTAAAAARIDALAAMALSLTL